MLSESIRNACILILLIYTGDSLTKDIKYSNCGPGVIQTVDVTPCDEEPCQIKKGTEANLKVAFTSAGTSISGITAKAFGEIFGQDVPYKLPKPDGCTGCNLTCPVQSGPHVYLNSLKIPTDVPNIRLAIKWEIVDQNNQVIFCFKFPAEVVS